MMIHATPRRSHFSVVGGAVPILLLGLLLTVSVAIAQEEDLLEWPQTIEVEQGTIVIYQPQIESVTQDQMESRCAVAVTPQGADGPTFGAMWFRSRLATDMDTRMVTLVSMQVLDSKFTDLDDDTVSALSGFLEQEIPRWNISFSLDRLIAGMDASGEDARGAQGLKSDPPEIIYRTTPSVLVLLDGDPILTEMEGYELQLLVNSAFFIVLEPLTEVYYLHGGESWYASSDLYGGWIPAPDLPSEVQRVDQAIRKEAAKADEEAGPVAEPEAEPDDEPLPSVPGEVEIVVKSQPAELIVSDGVADFAPIEGSSLLYLRNTESDVLMDISDQNYYVLVSGRWYRSKSLDRGPWDHVDFDDLPTDFAQISQESDMASVLVSVPGTAESREAVLESTIPQTAEVDRKTASCTVQYDGAPEFNVCGSGTVEHAINADKTVLRIEGRYYCCDEAIWFVADTPEGVWVVATELPAAIQDLPADCPAYNTKYVYIYDSDPEVVYVGYTSGYYGSYIYGPCVVYGTGWYYRPWWRNYYYPRPVTYGFRVHYNPWTGWGFSFGMSYGWLHIRVGRPWYGGWWGHGGYRHGYRHGYWRGRHAGYRHGFRQGYRHGARSGYRAGYTAGKRPSNTYKNRTTGVRKTQDRQGAQAGHLARSGDRASSNNRSGSRNDVYTDRDGNVYKRDGDTWQKREGNDWKDTELDKNDRSTRDGDRDGDRSTREGDRSEGDRSSREGSSDRSSRESDRSSQDRSSTDRSKQDSSRDHSSTDRSSGGSDSRDRSSADRSKSSGRSQEQQLNRDHQSRQRGSQKSQNYNSNRSRSGGSRGGGGRSGGGRRR